MKRTLTVVVALAMLGMALSGCEQKSAPVSGRVAVVDLDKVAAQVGWDRELQQSMDLLNQQLTNRYNAMREQFRAQIEAKDKEFRDALKDKLKDPIKDPLPKEQQDELNRMVQQAAQQLQVAQQQVNQESNRIRLGLINQYRDQIKPVVKKIAADAGFSVVVVPMENVIYWDDATSDLTAKVGDELARTRPAARTVVVPQPIPTLPPLLTTQPSGTRPPTTQPMR
jgi:Skp family chaperone for outer membrane proteins